MKLDLSDLDSEDPAQVAGLCIAHLQDKSDAEVHEFFVTLVQAVADIRKETRGASYAWDFVFYLGNALTAQTERYAIK